MFTSKSEKIRNATNKLKSKLIESIDNSITENQDIVLSNMEKSVSTMYRSIDTILSTYISNTERIISHLQSLNSQCHLNEQAINSLVGFRILEFIGKKVEEDSTINTASNSDLATKYPVERDWTSQSLTYLYNLTISDEELKEAERATQMIIKVKQ